MIRCAAVLLVVVVGWVGTVDSVEAQEQQYCYFLAEVAESAHSRRADGLTEATMRDGIPPRSAAALAPDSPQARLLLDMHDILDLMFAFEEHELDAKTFGAYHTERCRRREQGLPVLETMEAAVPALRLCATGDAALRQQCAVSAAAP